MKVKRSLQRLLNVSLCYDGLRSEHTKNKKTAANNNRGGLVIMIKMRNLIHDQNKTQIILDFFCDFGRAIPSLCEDFKFDQLSVLLH